MAQFAKNAVRRHKTKLIEQNQTPLPTETKIEEPKHSN